MSPVYFLGSFVATITRKNSLLKEMAKFNEPFDDIQKVFDEVIERAQLERFIKIKVLGNDKLKEIGKIQKSSDLLKHETGNDLYVFVNEVIFDQLTDEQKEMVAEELLAGVHFDTEKDKMIISKADVNTFSGILRKYTYENYEVLMESIKTLFAATNENK